MFGEVNTVFDGAFWAGLSAVCLALIHSATQVALALVAAKYHTGAPQTEVDDPAPVAPNPMPQIK